MGVGREWSGNGKQVIQFLKQNKLKEAIQSFYVHPDVVGASYLISTANKQQNIHLAFDVYNKLINQQHQQQQQSSHQHTKLQSNDLTAPNLFVMKVLGSACLKNNYSHKVSFLCVYLTSKWIKFAWGCWQPCVLQAKMLSQHTICCNFLSPTMQLKETSFHFNLILRCGFN